MGLYDTFELEGKCWKCGEPIKDWQTKQLDRCMQVYRKGDKIRGINIIEGTINVYSNCPSKYCDAWNDAVVQIRNGVVDSIKVINPE